LVADINIIKMIYFNDQILPKVKSIDFTEYIALSVFQGTQGSSGYEVDIQAIALDGDRIHVYVYFKEPFIGEVVSEVVTSPLHLVKIRKEGLDGVFVFELIEDGRVIRQTEAMINPD